jgi:hypothetical protein
MGKSLVEFNRDDLPLAPTQPRARTTNQLTISDETSPEGDAVTAFDYGLLAPELATGVRASAGRIKSHASHSAKDALAIGDELLGVKDALPRGKFGLWLTSEFGWDRRTANRYMSLARSFKDRPAVVAALPTALLYYLASPSAPAWLRDDIVTSISSGERFDAAQMRDMVLAARKQGRGRRAAKVRAGPKEDTVSFSPVEQTTRNAWSSSMKTDRDDPAEADEPVAEQAGGRKAEKAEEPEDDRADPKEDTVSFSPVEQTKSSPVKTDREDPAEAHEPVAEQAARSMLDGFEHARADPTEAVDRAADAAARSLLSHFKRTDAIRLLDVIETVGLEQVRQRLKAFAAPYD